MHDTVSYHKEPWGRRRTDIEIVVINLHLLLVIEDPSEKKNESKMEETTKNNDIRLISNSAI